MAEMIIFNKEFVLRTKEILNHYYDEEKNEITLLLNCLLALVCLPIENRKDEIDEQSEEFREKCVNKLKSLKNDCYWKNEDENHFFENIRNSIAHLNIKFIENENPIQNIIFFAKDNRKN